MAYALVVAKQISGLAYLKDKAITRFIATVGHKPYDARSEQFREVALQLLDELPVKHWNTPEPIGDLSWQDSGSV